MKNRVRYLLGLLFAFTVCASAATVDGLRIHSTVSGHGPRTLILVHGWTCDSSSWSEQIAALSKNYRVITLDLPGHGLSDSPTDGKFSMDLFARAVESVRAEAGANRVILIGHSMGTPVIVQYARMYPQHIAALVFVDGVTPATVPPNPDGGPPLAHPGDAMGGPNGRANREKMIGGLFVSSTSPEVRAKVTHIMLATPEATAVGAMNATFSPEGQFLDGKLDFPILALYSDHSRRNNPAYFQSHFTNFDYKEIPGTGHFLMLEKPDEFNKLLLDFLAKQAY